MLGRAGLGQCHTGKPWGPCWPCLGRGGTGSHTWVLGWWREVGLEAGLEGVREQGRGLILGLMTGLGRCCLGAQGMGGVGM